MATGRADARGPMRHPHPMATVMSNQGPATGPSTVDGRPAQQPQHLDGGMR
jgi:hypothetical protein